MPLFDHGCGAERIESGSATARLMESDQPA
jgi:hypothetical protein